LGGKEGEITGRRGIRRGKWVGGTGKGAAIGILREGRHVAKYCSAGEYRLG